MPNMASGFALSCCNATMKLILNQETKRGRCKLKCTLIWTDKTQPHIPTTTSNRKTTLAGDIRKIKRIFLIGQFQGTGEAMRCTIPRSASRSR